MPTYSTSFHDSGQASCSKNIFSYFSWILLIPSNGMDFSISFVTPSPSCALLAHNMLLASNTSYMFGHRGTYPACFSLSLCSLASSNLFSWASLVFYGYPYFFAPYLAASLTHSPLSVCTFYQLSMRCASFSLPPWHGQNRRLFILSFKEALCIDQRVYMAYFCNITGVTHLTTNFCLFDLAPSIDVLMLEEVSGQYPISKFPPHPLLVIKIISLSALIQPWYWDWL